jgi:hypothetical protein
MPKPVEITIENVDAPEMELPKNSRFGLKLAGGVIWIGIMIFVGEKGRQYGAAQAISHREQNKIQKDIASERQRQIQEFYDQSYSSPEAVADFPEKPNPVEISSSIREASGFEKVQNTVYESPITPLILSKLNASEVEDLILIIYARYGAFFESKEAQTWADQQSWYMKIPGKTIKDAEKEFSYNAHHNLTGLVERWNKIQVEDGQSPIPVDESPLAGRAVSLDLEGGTVSTPIALLKALPVDATDSVEQGNSSLEELQTWNLAEVRYEINQIYARHGMVFPKQEIQAHFEKQAWYKPKKGLTYDQTEEQFSILEHHYIEALATRRDNLLGKLDTQVIPLPEFLNPQQVTAWDALRVQNEINSVYARYGVDFSDHELQVWADKQPGYKRVIGRTFDDVDLLLNDNDRSNIELLAARRAQIKSNKSGRESQ